MDFGPCPLFYIHGPLFFLVQILCSLSSISALKVLHKNKLVQKVYIKKVNYIKNFFNNNSSQANLDSWLFETFLGVNVGFDTAALPRHL